MLYRPVPFDKEKPFEDMLKDLKSDNLYLRQAAARSLGIHGPKAICPLIEALGDKSFTVADYARWSLQGLGLEAIEWLIKEFNGAPEEIRKKRALWAIGHYSHPEGERRLEILNEVFNSYTGEIRQAAADSLRHMAQELGTRLDRDLKISHENHSLALQLETLLEEFISRDDIQSDKYTKNALNWIKKTLRKGLQP